MSWMYLGCMFVFDSIPTKSVLEYRIIRPSQPSKKVGY